MAKSNAFCTIAFVAAFFATAAFAQSVFSPEPEPTEEGLYIYTAGFNSRYVMPLVDGMNICPDDYPTGFNIRCISRAKYVRFFLNGQRFMSEYHAPFYMAGDVRGRIRPLTNLPRMAHIRCKGFQPKTNAKASGVTFRC